MPNDKDVSQEAIPMADKKSIISPIREKALEGMKLHAEGIKLRDFASELGVTWQKLLPELKGLVKEKHLQLKESYYYPMEVEITSSTGNSSDNDLQNKLLSFISDEKKGITLKEAGTNMGIPWQKLLPAAKVLITSKEIVKDGNRYISLGNFGSFDKTTASEEKTVKEISRETIPIKEKMMTREEAKVVDTTSAPSAAKKDKKKQVGTIEGVALILSVLAFFCFWSWTLPSMKMVGQDQIALTESVQQMHKDLSSVKAMIESAKTDMDIMRLKEIQIILDNLIARKPGNVSTQAIKIKKEINDLIWILTPNKIPAK